MSEQKTIEKKGKKFKSRISIQTEKNITSIEVGNFLIGIDKIYRLIIFTESMYVQDDYLKNINQIDGLVNKLVKKYLCGNSDLKMGIIEILSVILPYERKDKIKINDAELVYQETRKRHFDLNDLKGSLIQNLSNSLKFFYLNKGVKFNTEISGDLNYQDELIFRQIIIEGSKSFDFETLYNLTNKNFLSLELSSINYNSPGSFDFLGIGKILEVVKDFILELKKENKNKIEEKLLTAKLAEQQEINLSKKLDNIEKYLNLREKAIALNDESIDKIFNILEDSKKSISLISNKITEIKIVSEK